MMQRFFYIWLRVLGQHQQVYVVNGIPHFYTDLEDAIADARQIGRARLDLASVAVYPEGTSGEGKPLFMWHLPSSTPLTRKVKVFEKQRNRPARLCWSISGLRGAVVLMFRLHRKNQWGIDSDGLWIHHADPPANWQERGIVHEPEGCPFHGGPCWLNCVSELDAEEALELMLNEGDESLWRWLEDKYRVWFCKEEKPDDGNRPDQPERANP